MIITFLEAGVGPEQWAALAAAFEAGSEHLPKQMLHSFLAQDMTDRTLWRGISIWRSRDALQEYRGSVETPGGVLMFRSVGAEPVLSIYDVAVHGSREADGAGPGGSKQEIMIVMEGHVPEEKTAGLVAAYEAGSRNMPAPMLQMFLAHCTNDRTLWRAITVWRSREALIEYRQQSGEGHRGEAMFRSAGAEPVRYMLDVAVHGSAVAA